MRGARARLSQRIFVPWTVAGGQIGGERYGKYMESICGNMAWFFMAFHSVSIRVMLEMFFCADAMCYSCPFVLVLQVGLIPFFGYMGSSMPLHEKTTTVTWRSWGSPMVTVVSRSHDLITWMGCHDDWETPGRDVGLHISKYQLFWWCDTWDAVSQGYQGVLLIVSQYLGIQDTSCCCCPHVWFLKSLQPDQPSTPQATQELGELGFLQFMAMLDHSRSRPHFSTFGFGGNMWKYVEYSPQVPGIFPAGHLPSLWSLQLFGGSGGWGTGGQRYCGVEATSTATRNWLVMW